MLNLKSCYYFYKKLGNKTLMNKLKCSVSLFSIRREYSNSLDEVINLNNIDCRDKIIYNEVLYKHTKRLLKRKTSQEIDNCESAVIKYLKNENNVSNEQTKAVSKDNKSEVLNFPYETSKRYSVINDDSADIFSNSVKCLTPSDNEKVTIPSYQSSNFDSFAQKFGDVLKEYRKESTELENDNIEFEVQFGSSDPSVPISSVPCGGCGALLHCTDPSIPGFLPKEVFHGLSEKHLQSEICRRCYFLKEFDIALGVNVSSEEYPKIISEIKKKEKTFVILMIDLLDFPCSIWPGISDLIGSSQPVIIAANKIDLLIQDGEHFQSHLKTCLLNALEEKEMNLKNVKDVVFISAKTGYGIEDLITSLYEKWADKGDIYLVGCTNVGKSTLFNSLIQSDLCKNLATVFMIRATISAWPGTTLNLLKFPIFKPRGRRRFYRRKRLISEQREIKSFEHFKENLLLKGKIQKQIPLKGHVGQTFSFSPAELQDLFNNTPEIPSDKPVGLEPSKYKGKWCFDTPGVVNPDQIVNILTTSELLLTLSKDMIIPRNFKLKPGISLFIGGLARVDYVAGNFSAWFTVYASKELPLTLTETKNADCVYEKLLGSPLFRVPVGDKMRLSKWPGLSFQTFNVCGRHDNKASADIVLSSVGWVSVAPRVAQNCKINAWTPEGRGLYLRDAIILNGPSFRGEKISKTPAYHTSVKVIDNISVTEEPQWTGIV